MKITIIGSGAWGKALYSVIKQKSSDVSFWNQKDKIIETDITLIAISVQAIRQVLNSIKIKSAIKIIVNGSKGIEINSYKLPFEIIKDVLGKNIDYFSVIGPSFAKEVLEKMPTIVNLGYIKDQNKEIVKDLFQTDYFRIRLIKGVEALELASALKNVYAISCGLVEGLGMGVNTRVKLIILAIEELKILFEKMNLEFNGTEPGIIGDLILTSSSLESRNFTFGSFLAKHSAKESLKKIGSTIEGYYTTNSVPHFIEKYNVKMPLANFVYNIIYKNNSSNIKEQFMNFIKEV